MGKLEKETVLEEEEVYEEVDDSEVDDEEVEDEQEEETEEETEEEEPDLYTHDQVEAAVKTRVKTLNKRFEKLKPYQSIVQKISDVTGLSTEELLTRLSSMSDAEQAKILGLTPQQMAQKRAQKPKVDTETVNLKRELEEQKLTLLPEYKDLSLFREEVYDMMDDNPKLTMKQAYQLVKGDLATTAVKRDAEQRAVARMTKSSNQKVIKPGSSASQAKKLEPSVVMAAKRVGMDPAEYAAYANIENLDQFEKLKSKKKG